MEFKIEKNIPIPDGNRSRTGYFDSLGKMEVGDSFKFDIKLRNRISGAASFFKFRHGREFTIRKLNDKECRCWRIK
jgi:hypothetical protein